MKTNATQQQTIREYLLGRLPSEQQAQFEELLLTSEEVYEELGNVEDELVDEYVREELRASDRESFESHFIAAPEHQEKLNFARAFTKYLGVQSTSQAQELPTVSSVDARTASVDSREVRPTAEGPRKSRSRFFGFLGIQNPALGYAMAAVLVLVVGGMAWTVWKNFSPSGPRDPGHVVSFVLTPGVTRDVRGGGNRITVPANTDTLRLQLLLPEDGYQSYEASLLNADGHTLTTKSNLRAETVNGQPAASFEVPANVVPPGDYRVKLNGVAATGERSSLSSYSLRITTAH